MNHIFPDNGGRRSGIERRQFSYTQHIPEQRSGKDRRLKPRTSKYKNILNGQGQQWLCFFYAQVLWLGLLAHCMYLLIQNLNSGFRTCDIVF